MHRRVVSVALVGAAVATSVPLAIPAQTLRGSLTSVERAYDRASDRGLYFYQTVKGVQGAAAKGRFVRLAGNANYRTHRVTLPYATATTRTFVERLAGQYRSACGEQLVVTSAVRPQSRQLANSSPLSVHPTGTAIDFRKPRGACLRWLRSTLLDLERKGVVDATEEYTPPHFHVVVFNASYERYLASMGVGPTPSKNAGAPVALATVARTTPPASTPGRAATAPASRRYTVRRGDSFWSIAERFDTSVTAIRRLNPGKSVKIIPGQKLVIPGA